MSADVISIADRCDVDAAWEAYAAHVRKSEDDRTLLRDRGFMERWAVLEARFKRLSLMPRAY